MFNFKALLTTALVATLSVTSASPVKASPDVTPSITVCTSVEETGCLTIPIVSSACIDLTGGLAGFNQEISLAIIPDGFICTFYQAFSCVESGTIPGGTENEVLLQGGTWNFFSVPGLTGNTDFNDLTSSLTCSPLI
ncbi:hypothetical protein C8R45DRAFT_1015772 [Mycena sanguinolenta]|nr:hypothetical protein C8R45DRAFT_1015772 [Mycena sanguinolenta]